MVGKHQQVGSNINMVFFDDVTVRGDLAKTTSSERRSTTPPLAKESKIIQNLQVWYIHRATSYDGVLQGGPVHL